MCFDKRITEFFIHEYIQFNQIIFVKKLCILEKFLVLIQVDLTLEEAAVYHISIEWCFSVVSVVANEMWSDTNDNMWCSDKKVGRSLIIYTDEV